MIGHSYVRSCTYECMHVSTHTYTPPDLCGPPVRLRAPVPLWFSCPMVSCWADISVCLDDSLTWCLFGLATCFHLNQYTVQGKKERRTDERSNRQERVPIRPDKTSTGRRCRASSDATQERFQVGFDKGSIKQTEFFTQLHWILMKRVMSYL